MDVRVKIVYVNGVSPNFRRLRFIFPVISTSVSFRPQNPKTKYQYYQLLLFRNNIRNPFTYSALKSEIRKGIVKFYFV